ncbi:MAG: putative riboflavin synthase alpha subunit [Actinomycetia bacterium]|nr:putative riboflavin synthase alpha subunit [Actinomycetes bacterium]
MFTGIVEELGEVVAVDRLPDAARLTVRGPRVTAAASHGDSIAVNGVCLTVTDSSDKTFTADVMAETLRRTGLGALSPGSPVNLERPVELGGRLGGHLVQGHADGTGEILSRTPGEHWDVVRIATPPDLARYIVLKGSITVDGVSLTVSALGATGSTGATGSAGGETPGPWFEVSLIPTTLEMTTLGRLQPGSQVNLEVDVIAKYVESLLASGPPGRPATSPPPAAGTASQARNEQPGARS